TTVHRSSSFSFYCYTHSLYLSSFPTRRSSDLVPFTVSVMGVDSRADGGAAWIKLKQVITYALDTGHGALNHRGPGAKFLPQCHGNSDLHLGAAHFDDCIEFIGLILQRLTQYF